IYIKNEYRGRGIGSKFFEKLQDMYGDNSVRFRLEVEPENERAVAVYEKCGYKKLPYMQMTKEL
ncbi:MAG: GNAT family N-acetyltransferase, partial [Lachnospiraceae bacterium]|nr:GNAT family N-acetyltransferase [Lachnospiraceae bacterium]